MPARRGPVRLVWGDTAAAIDQGELVGIEVEVGQDVVGEGAGLSGIQKLAL